jgi:hypothetical protein
MSSGRAKKGKNKVQRNVLDHCPKPSTSISKTIKVKGSFWRRNVPKDQDNDDFPCNVFGV